MSRIVSLGTASQDLYLIDRDDFSALKNDPTPKIPVASKIEIDKIAYHAGGGGLNAALTFSRHNHETILISNLAKDPAGNAILRLLDQENIDTSYLNFIPRKSTATSVILLNSKNSESTTLYHPGACTSFNHLNPADLDLANPDWLYVSTLSGNMDILLQFFEKAKKNQIKIMWRPGPAELAQPKKLIGLLEDVDILLVSKATAAKLVPGNLLTELVYRLNNYVKIVIITDGPMGGIASNRTDTYRFGIYEDVKIKDRLGAGDAFGAGFLAHFTAGKSFRESLIFASANATSVITKIGATTGSLTGTEPLHLMPIQKV